MVRNSSTIRAYRKCKTMPLSHLTKTSWKKGKRNDDSQRKNTCKYEGTHLEMVSLRKVGVKPTFDGYIGYGLPSPWTDDSFSLWMMSILYSFNS